MAERRLTVIRDGGAGAARRGLGEMPLTLFLIVAAIVLYFYIRRAHLGIDRHPAEGERQGARPTAPRPTVRITPARRSFLMGDESAVDRLGGIMMGDSERAVDRLLFGMRGATWFGRN